MSFVILKRYSVLMNVGMNIKAKDDDISMEKDKEKDVVEKTPRKKNIH